jgi:hypothetical protein
MNKEKYARLTVVLDLKTDRAIRYVSAITETGVSELVRGLISVPAVAMADALSAAVEAKTPEQRKAVEDQMDMFVEGAYGDYLRVRGTAHG